MAVNRTCNITVQIPEEPDHFFPRAYGKLPAIGPTIFSIGIIPSFSPVFLATSILGNPSKLQAFLYAQYLYASH